MSIFDTLFNRLGYERKTQEIANPPGHLLAHAGAAQYEIPDYDLAEHQADLYRRLSWVHIAVSMVAKSCATTAFEVKKLIGEDEEDIPNHPFELLLKKPNPLMSRFEFLEATIAFYKLTGNSYWWINRSSATQEPNEIWVIPPQQMKPVPDERLYLRGYLYNPGDGKEFPLPLHEVVHFKGFNPLNTFVGMSSVEPIANVAVGDLAQQKWNTAAFADNNARLPGMITFADPIPDSEWHRLLSELDENAKKRNIMALRNVGPGGVNWIQAAMTKKEMEFLSGRQFTKEEIYAIFAPGLASMLDPNSTEANSKAGKATFNDYTLWPVLTAVAEKITNDLLPVYGENITGEFEDIRYSDRAMELQEQLAAEKVLLINEMRQRFYQLDPLDDSDVRGKMFVTQIGAAPVSMSEEEEPEEGDEFAGEESPIPAPEIFQPRQPSEPDEKGDEVKAAIMGELGQWERWSKGRVKQDKPLTGFVTEHIPLALKTEILSMLVDANTQADITAIFEAVKTEQFGDYGDFTDLVAALNAATKALEKGESIE